MESQKKKYLVKIFGDSYHLVSDEQEDLVMQTATLIDSLMNDLAKQSGITDTKKLAVLAALQIASKVVLLENNLQQKFEKVKKLEQLLDEGLNSALS